jgi:cysteine synthase
VDIFVGGVGTGGTISGAGRFLKSKKPGLKVVIAEPHVSSVPSEENLYPDEIDGVHKVSEVPSESLPKNFDSTIADEVIALTTAEARKTAREIIAEEGVFAGISSGAVLWAATQLAGRPENAGKLIVALLPDSGERYLGSTVIDD